MENKNIFIGSHVAMSAPNFYLGSVKEALSYNANAFMFYTGAPQNSFRKPLSECKIEEGRKLLKEAGIDESKIVVHAPYFINGANFAREDIYDLSIKTIINELQRTFAFGSKILVLHPGSHIGLGAENGILALAKALDLALSSDGTDVKIAIETMAGKGHEIGANFEQVRSIIDHCEHKDRLGVCLDTCHISDAGYDIINDLNSVIELFDKVVGLDRLLVVHVNDSKNPTGAHKDRHENIGYGYIGFKNLYNVVHHPKLSGIPMILETPYINEKAPYKQEIEMLRSGNFIDNWKENF